MKMEKTEVILEEVKKQKRLAGPLIATNLLMFLLQVVSVMVVGNLGELALSGAAMAISFAGVTGFSMLVGMGCTLEALCGQAFGAKQYNMLGVQLQKAMLVLTISCIPVAFLWFFTEKFLISFHQDPEISKKAGQYARWMVPSLFAYGLAQCQIRFLQAQNIVIPLMLSSGVTVLLHGFTSWVLVYKTSIGYVGAALSISISYWFIVMVLALFIKFSPACKSTWTGFSKDALHGIPSFIKLAIPSAVMICSEYWSFEAVVILSGLLANPKLETSAMTICLNTCSTLYMITFGLGAAISTRVSNELGAANLGAAKLAIFIALFIATAEGLLVGTTTILLRHILGHAFSKEKEVIDHVASLMPFVATVHFIDANQCVLNGIVRGCGWQKKCAIINLGSYYVVGLPIGTLLAFKHGMGGKGLWIGIICALFTQVLLLSILSINNKWESEGSKAIETVRMLEPIEEVVNPKSPQHLSSNDLDRRKLELDAHV